MLCYVMLCYVINCTFVKHRFLFHVSTSLESPKIAKIPTRVIMERIDRQHRCEYGPPVCCPPSSVNPDPHIEHTPRYFVVQSLLEAYISFKAYICVTVPTRHGTTPARSVACHASRQVDKGHASLYYCLSCHSTLES